MTFDESKIPLYKVSLFHFARDVLGFKDLMPANYEWCVTLQAKHTEPRRMVLLKPRGTYKTSIYTIAYPLWLFGKYPDRTILIIGGSAKVNRKNFDAIERHLKYNREYHKVFGKVYDKDRSTKEGIWHTERSMQGDAPNIKAVSKGTNIVGFHFDTIIVDDIVTNLDRESETEREKTKRYFQTLPAILNKGGEIIVVGTRWHPDDLYHYIYSVVNPRLKKNERYTFEVETLYEYAEDGSIDFKRPRFLPKYTEQEIQRLKAEMQDLGFFYSQYMNNPQPSDLARFSLEKLVKTAFDITRDLPLEKLKKMRIVTYWDPAMSEKQQKHVCYSAIVTIAFDATEDKYYVLDATLERMNIQTGIERLKGHVTRWNPHVVSFESNVAGDILKKEITKMITNLGPSYNPLITEVAHFHTQKDVRINTLVALFETGALRFRSDWELVYPLLVDQIVTYPIGRYKDGPDAVAGAVEVFRMKSTKTLLSAVKRNKPAVDPREYRNRFKTKREIENENRIKHLVKKELRKRQGNSISDFIDPSLKGRL